MEKFESKFSDIFMYTWVIDNNSEIVHLQDPFDNPIFDINLSGVHSKWGVSIRCWKNADGHHLLSSTVLCLNHISNRDASHFISDCDSTAFSSSLEGHSITQGYFLFQFTLYNHECDCEDTIALQKCYLPEKDTDDLICIGYQQGSIENRHLDANSCIKITLKMSINSLDEIEQHTLFNDMQNMMEEIFILGSKEIESTLPSVVILMAQDEEYPVHRCVLAAKSKVFADLFRSPIGTNGHTVHEIVPFGSTKSIMVHRFDIDDLKKEYLQKIIMYAYTGYVIGLDRYANSLLAASTRYGLTDLKNICAQYLAEKITPYNVASLLYLAESCRCYGLKREVLSYLEGHAAYVGKNRAWKVMEKVSPKLFQEACAVVFGE